MAKKKGGGSTNNGRDSVAKRRGVKRFGGEAVNAGEIVVRQKGTKFRAGENCYLGTDFTLHAGVTGKVRFSEKAVRRFDGRRYNLRFVNIDPA